VGTNDDDVDLYKPMLFETEADVLAIMNQAAKDDELKKDKARAMDNKKFTVQRLKAMAEYKIIYCDMAQENISL
jgi:Ser/Thr protein kinase RdoA (MazF antagonist)